MMQIERFEARHERDFEMLIGMHKTHMTTRSLPRIGWAAYYLDRCIGIIFLRNMECGEGLIDGFITNPCAPYAVRKAAIEELEQTLFSEAKSLGFVRVLAHCVRNSVIKKALSIGFKPQPETLMSKELIDVTL